MYKAWTLLLLIYLESQQRLGCGTKFCCYQVGLNNSLIGINNSKFGGLDATWSSNARNLSDLISFGNSLSKPAMEFHATSHRPSIKGPETSSSTKGSERISGASDGKKKISEDSSDTLFKKSKLDSSNTSTIKLQPPKVKLGDKITALQQIVSPFGKTDTASVLLEAINYIRILQEQVQRCPKQPGGHECGYVVMRYMKEIIQDLERAFVSRWSTKNRKVSYSRTELDEVRFEALSHIEGYM